MEEYNILEKKLFKITWPIFIDTLLFMLLGSIDIFMLGKYSDNAVAAVGAVNQIISMVNLLFSIITTGTTILCCQYLGTKNPKENIIRLSGVSIGFNGLIGIILSILLFSGCTFILKCMNIAPILTPLSKVYMNLVGGFIFVQAISMTFTAIIRSHGHTRLCMYVSLLMNLFNVVFDYALIFGKFGLPSMGVTGAALATVVSKILGAVILGYFLFKKVLLGFSLKYFDKFPKKDLINMFKIGLPTAGEQLSYSLMQIAVTVILTLISVDSMTTNNYVNNIVMFVYIFAISMGQGSSILVGRLVGKGDNDGAYKLCLKSLKKSIIVSFLMSILSASCGKLILGIFTTNKNIIFLGSSALILDAILEPGRAFNIVIINCLKAAGDVKYQVYVGIISMWIVGAGLGYILAIKFNLGLIGVWIALTLDEWVRGIIMYARWKSRKWENRAFV